MTIPPRDWPQGTCRKVGQVGTTLLELLVVVAIIAVLVALLLPALSRGVQRGKQAVCRSNLRQVGVGLNSFAHDHSGKLPWEVSLSDGGASESNRFSPTVPAGTTPANGYRVNPQVFRVLSNSLGSPRILTCPGTRQRSTGSFSGLGFQNVSYFFNPHGVALGTLSVLSGDHNLVAKKNGSQVEYQWTQERHDGRGQLLYGDGRVESFRHFLPMVLPLEVIEQPGSSTVPSFPAPWRPGVSGGGDQGLSSDGVAGTSEGGGSGTASSSGLGSIRVARGDVLVPGVTIRETLISGAPQVPAFPRARETRETIKTPASSPTTSLSPPESGVQTTGDSLALVPSTGGRSTHRSFLWLYLILLLLALIGGVRHLQKSESSVPEPVLLQSTDVLPPTALAKPRPQSRP